MKKIINNFLLFFVFLSVLALPIAVFAQNIIKIENPLGTNTFEGLINNIINYLFTISLVIAPLMFIFAGFLFVTAEGKTEKVEKAKDLIWWTIIGFVIILLARGLVEMLQSMLGVS